MKKNYFDKININSTNLDLDYFYNNKLKINLNRIAFYIYNCIYHIYFIFD